jgi:hypothetical protein
MCLRPDPAATLPRCVFVVIRRRPFLERKFAPAPNEGEPVRVAAV